MIATVPLDIDRSVPADPKTVAEVAALLPRLPQDYLLYLRDLAKTCLQVGQERPSAGPSAEVIAILDRPKDYLILDRGQLMDAIYSYAAVHPIAHAMDHIDRLCHHTDEDDTAFIERYVKVVFDIYGPTRPIVSHLNGTLLRYNYALVIYDDDTAYDPRDMESLDDLSEGPILCTVRPALRRGSQTIMRALVSIKTPYTPLEIYPRLRSDRIG